MRVSRASLYDYIKAGRLKGVRLGRRRLFSREEVTAFLGEAPPEKAGKPEVEFTPELKDARNKLKECENLLVHLKGNEIILIIKHVKETFNRAGDIEGLTMATFFEGYALLFEGKPSRARQRFNEALDKVSRLGNPELEGRILAGIAAIESLKGNFEKAVDINHRVLKCLRDADSRAKIAIVHTNMGKLYAQMNRHQEALFQYRQALEMAGGIKVQPHFEPTTLLSISDIYSSIGEHQLSFGYAKKAYQLCLKRKLDEMRVSALNYLGRSMTNIGDKQAAADYFRRSYEEWSRLNPAAKDSLVSMAINSLLALEDYKGAMEHLRTREKLLREMDRETPAIAGLYFNYAKCNLGLKRYKKAAEYIEMGLSKQIELGQLANLRTHRRYAGRIYAASGDYRRANEFFRGSLFSLNADIDRSVADGLPAYQEHLVEDTLDDFAGSIFLDTNDKAAFKDITLLVSESANRVINENSLYPDPIKGRFVARKFARAASAIVEFHRKAYHIAPGKLMPSQVKHLGNRISRLKATKAKLSTEVARKNPLYLPLQGEDGPSVDEIRGLLKSSGIPRGTAVLFIYVAEKKGQGFLLNSSGIAHRKEIDMGKAEAREYMDDFRAMCATVGTLIRAGSPPPIDEQRQVKSILKILYDRLFSPFAGALDPDKPLLVLTDPLLNFLPFEALFDGRRHLCEYMQILRVLSPSFLRAFNLPGRPRSAGKHKIFDVNSMTGENGSKGMSYTEGFSSRRLKQLHGSAATIEAIRPNIGKYSAFLYTGNYFYQENNPEQASLSMASGPGLTANEFFSQRYDLSGTRMVILNTGGISREEFQSRSRFLPIQRAFLTAGANSVTSFLWRMDEGSLSNLIRPMLGKFINDGIPPPEAARQVRRELIGNPVTSHPYFWAGLLNFNLAL